MHFLSHEFRCTNAFFLATAKAPERPKKGPHLRSESRVQKRGVPVEDNPFADLQTVLPSVRFLFVSTRNHAQHSSRHLSRHPAHTTIRRGSAEPPRDCRSHGPCCTIAALLTPAVSKTPQVPSVSVLSEMRIGPTKPASTKRACCACR